MNTNNKSFSIRVYLCLFMANTVFCRRRRRGPQCHDRQTAGVGDREPGSAEQRRDEEYRIGALRCRWKISHRQGNAAGTALLQGIHQGATYNLLLPPGGPTTGVSLKVYDSTAKPEAGKVAQHMLLIEPSASEIRVSDTYMFDNRTNTTFNDPSKGSVLVYVPDAAKGSLRVTINAPGGMPIQREAEKTSQPGVYKISYPIKPGESRFDVDYVLPASRIDRGQGDALDPQARIVTPAAVTLSGDGIQSMGQEPKTQAHVYLVTGSSYDLKVEGTGTLREPAAAAPDEESGSPPVLAQYARVYTRLPIVLGLVFAILAAGWRAAISER
jgi:hypothetical protein